MPPKGTHTLIPETCKYVIVRDRRDFTDVTKDPEMVRLYWII